METEGVWGGAFLSRNQMTRKQCGTGEARGERRLTLQASKPMQWKMENYKDGRMVETGTGTGMDV